MDHELRNLYQQMKSSNGADSSSKNTLRKAYESILLKERTAFYAKDISPGEEVPTIAGLEALGAVEEPLKIKHTISSMSVLPVLKKAMSSEVTGFGSIKGVDEDRIARDFIATGVSGVDLEKITSNRSKLTGFFDAVQKSEIFNLADVIVTDIKSKLEVESAPENLISIFKRLFNEEGTISGTAVGKGELAICLFTNCSKGVTGDLLCNGKTIEIKGKGGRLGPADYSQSNTARDLVQFLNARTKDKTVGFNRELVRLKTSIRKYALELEKLEMYSKIFTEKLKKTLNDIADNIDNPKVFSFIEQASLSKKYPVRSDDVVWEDFNKQGFLQPKTEDIPAAPIEKAIVAKVQKSIRDFLFSSNNGIFKKGRLEKITSKNVDLQSLQTQSFTVAVQNFFLNDLGLTPEEASEAFLLTKSLNIDVSKHLPEIKSYFQQHYSKMVEGDVKYLQAAIFAFQLTIYAQAGDDQEGDEGQHFDYFMIMNPESMSALALNVNKANLFTYLSTVFLNNSQKIELSIRADGRQGASAVTLKS